MRPFLLVFLLASFLFQSQKQPTSNKQGAQEQVKKPTANKPVPDTRQDSPEAVVKQARPVESQPATDPHKEQDRAQTVKEINDTLIVVFTGALAVVGFLQWHTLRQHERWMRRNVAVANAAANAAKKSAEVAESALKLGKRADVLLEGATFSHGQIMSGTDSCVILQFRNFGETRAKDTRLSLNLLIDGVPPTDCTQIPSVVIGAGDAQKVSSERFGKFMTQQTAQDLFSGKVTLRFEGEAAYKDIFGDPHRSYNEGTLDIGTGTFRIDKQEAD